MSVPSLKMVCQCVIVAAVIISVALWFALPRYSFTASGQVVFRGDVRTGHIIACIQTSNEEVECPR